MIATILTVLVCVCILIGQLLLAYKRPGIAFVTLPFVTLAVICIAAATDTPENLVVASLLFMLTLAVVAAAGWNRENRRWFHRGAWYMLIAILAVLFMGIILEGTSALRAGYVLGAVFIALGVAIPASLVHCGLVSRRVRPINVFSTLSASMKQNLPLPMALDCAAAGDWSATGVVLRNIKTWLVKGCSLADAIRQGYPGCPPGALAMIASAEKVGQLPAALAAIESDVKSKTVGPRRIRPIHPFYPVVVVVLVVGLVIGIMTFVMPVIVQMAEDVVGSDLPRPTRILLSVSHAFSHGILLTIILLGMLLFILGRSLYVAARRRRGRGGVILWLGDSLRWWFPFMRGFEERLAMVQVLELLKISLVAGCPVNDAIRRTLDLDVNQFFRRRLQCWLDRVEQGENVSQAARRCRLGPVMAWAFDDEINASSTPAILDMLETHFRWSYLYRLNVTRFIAWPVGIVLLGAIVGFIVLATFLPAVGAINALSINLYP